MTLPAAQSPPSGALVVAPTKILTSTERHDLVKSLSGSTFLPTHFRNNEANIFYAVELGQSFGLEPVSIMKNIHVFDDGQGRIQAALSADLMVSLARRAGHVVHVKATKSKAIATLVRGELLTMDIERVKALSDLGLPLKDYFTFEETWSEEDAMTAGLLGKGNWKKYPRAMLQARAKAAIVRAAASEVLIQMSDASAQHGGLIVHGERIMPVTTHTADELGDDSSFEVDGEIRIERADRPSRTRTPSVVMNADLPATAKPVQAPAAPVQPPGIPRQTNQEVVDYVKANTATSVAKTANDIAETVGFSVDDKTKRLIALHAALKYLGRLPEKIEAPEGVMPIGDFISSLTTQVKSAAPAK